jgi:tartrate dehydrogenase/decarboxylase/D-malate dehydrogenase
LGVSNPLASIWSASQMLDYFGYDNWGKRIIDIIEEMLVENLTLTPDMGGTASTSEVGNAFIEKLCKN